MRARTGRRFDQAPPREDEDQTRDPNLGKFTPPGAEIEEGPISRPGPFKSTGAGEEIRTLDPNLGKLRRPIAPKQKSPAEAELFRVPTGAGEEIRTLDPNLGKVVLYH
jgi:hypothetical protein